jgi:hypothetical protein
MIEGILVRIKIKQQCAVDHTVKVDGKLSRVKLIYIFADNSSLVAPVISYDFHLVWGDESFNNHHLFLTLTKLEVHTMLLRKVVLSLPGQPFRVVKAMQEFFRARDFGPLKSFLS